MDRITLLRRVSDDDLADLHARPDRIFDFLEERDGDLDDEDGTDVDTVWHILHFLMTGTGGESSSSLGFLVGGGLDVGDQDIGHGPARSFAAAQVREIAGRLERLTAEDLRRRFQPEVMRTQAVYTMEAGGADLNVVLAYFDEMKQFIAETARRNLGLLLYVT